MIRKVLAASVLCLGVSLSASAMAIATLESEQTHQAQRTEHYQPLPSNTLEQAIKNLHSHNAHLQQLLDQPSLSMEDMVKVHELSYTLELALQRLSRVLDDTADVLEEVHLGSETMDNNRVRDNGERYLEVMNTLLQ